MGRPMLERVLHGGFDVAFFARRPEVVQELTQLGAAAATSPAELASSCDVVVVCVFTDQQVRDLCLGPDGLLEAMRAGSVLAVHTTCSPATPAQLADEGAARGVGVLDAAFSGGPDDAAAGAITLLVGGDADILEKARPPLATYAAPILHVGRPGDAQRVKLVNNALFGANIALIAEAERLASDLGIDPAAALEAISHCSGSSYALGTVRGAGSSARLQELAGRYIGKDVATVKQIAAEAGTGLGLLATVLGDGDEGAEADGPSTGSLQRLWDIEQIKQLKARYFRFLDTKDWAGFRDLFTEDCVHHLPEESEVRTQNNEEYLASVRVILDKGITTHHGHMPEIALLSDTEAEGIWAMFDYVQVDGPDGRIDIQGYGHYLETYRKCPDGRWRISSKRNERLRLDRLS